MCKDSNISRTFKQSTSHMRKHYGKPRYQTNTTATTAKTNTTTTQTNNTTKASNNTKTDNKHKHQKPNKHEQRTNSEPPSAASSVSPVSRTSAESRWRSAWRRSTRGWTTCTKKTKITLNVPCGQLAKEQRQRWTERSEYKLRRRSETQRGIMEHLPKRGGEKRPPPPPAH